MGLKYQLAGNSPPHIFLDAIELCTTDCINEKFPPSDILKIYIYVFIFTVVRNAKVFEY